MIIEFNMKRVANLLKSIINQQCEEGFKWYEEVGEMPNLFDIHHAIEILENYKAESMEVRDVE